MIPMFRVFSSENFLGMIESGAWPSVLATGKKMGPSGPRALLVGVTVWRRYLLEVSILRKLLPRGDTLQRRRPPATRIRL